MELEPGKLFLHGISSDTKEDHLREYFETFGEVVKSMIKKRRINGHCRFGFITFKDPAVAERVVKERHTINGRTVKAKNSVPMIYQHLMSKKNGSIQRSPGRPASAKKIFVGDLASAVTESEFKKYFGQFGTITDVLVNYDQNTQRSMRSGFITYDSEEAVDKVLLKAFHVLNGKVIQVKRAFTEELSAGSSRSHLGGCDNGRNGVRSSLNANTQGYNPTSRMNGQCNPVSDGRSGYPPLGSSNREGSMVDKDNNGSISNVIKIEPITKKERSRDPAKCPSEAEESDESPLRSIPCLKNKEDMKQFEETEDCFILGFDPYESLDISKLSISDSLDSTIGPELSVVAEKGQVACRDYPHSRHLCMKNPFTKTPHESFCKLCYCYICDLAAPCEYWTGEEGHCHAIDDEAGKFRRATMREQFYS